MDTSAIIALATAVAQLGVATAAYRLGSKVAARQDAQDERVEAIDVRVTVLEQKVA